MLKGGKWFWLFPKEIPGFDVVKEQSSFAGISIAVISIAVTHLLVLLFQQLA